MGGRISKVEDDGEAMEQVVDKVVINSAVVRQPDLIDQVAKKYGSSRLVVGIDARPDENDWWVYVSGGRTKTTNRLVDWAKEVESRGAGEILFTSMEHDGTKAGFALEILQRLKSTVGIPLIASGGAGKREDCLELLQQNEEI